MSAVLTALVDIPVKIPFPVFDVDGVTPLSGLVDGDFTNKTLIKDDAVQALTVTVTEVGSTGKYYAEFTPDDRGFWYVEVTTPGDEVYGHHVDVGIFDTLDRMRKETSNAHKIDLVTQEEIAYDDDGSTELQKWDVFTDGGEPVDTFTGVQIRRGAPKIAKP